MHPYDIIFVLNETEKLVIDLKKPFEQMPCYCQTTISFDTKLKEYILTVNDDLESSMQMFSESLTKSLNNKLQLHASITKDIGYLHNEGLYYQLNDTADDDELHLNPNLTYEGDFDTWVGIQYQIWSCRQWAAWMYNDEHGGIVFEITPRYPGFFLEENESVEMPSYKEWIQTYQPAVVRFISKDIAQKWLSHAKDILAYIKARFDKYADDTSDNKKIVYEKCPQK